MTKRFSWEPWGIISQRILMLLRESKVEQRSYQTTENHEEPNANDQFRRRLTCFEAQVGINGYIWAFTKARLDFRSIQGLHTLSPLHASVQARRTLNLLSPAGLIRWYGALPSQDRLHFPTILLDNYSIFNVYNAQKYPKAILKCAHLCHADFKESARLAFPISISCSTRRTWPSQEVCSSWVSGQIWTRSSEEILSNTLVLVSSANEYRKEENLYS